MQLKKLAIFVGSILFFAAAFALGVFANNICYQKNILNCNKNYCYNQGWDGAQQFISAKYSTNDSGGTIDAKRNFINGKILAVQSDKIIVEYKGSEILPNQDLITREVSLDSNAEIDKLVKKDSKVYAAELADYHKNIKDPKQLDSPENYPAEYNYVKTSFADFKVGQDVYIQASTNIQDQKTFTASIVKILD